MKCYVYYKDGTMRDFRPLNPNYEPTSVLTRAAVVDDSDTIRKELIDGTIEDNKGKAFVAMQLRSVDDGKVIYSRSTDESLAKNKCSMSKRIEAFAKKSEAKVNEDWEFNPANVSAYLEGDEGSEDGCFDNYLSEVGEFLGEQHMSDDELISMDELNEYMSGRDAMDVILSAFNGYDYNPHRSDHTEPFNPNRDWFYLNAYGNLVSVDDRDRVEYYKRCVNMEEFAEWLIDNGRIEESDYLDWLQDTGKIDADEYDRRISGGDEE